MQIGLYTNKADITPEDLRQLIQSSVFLAESIYVPATVRPALMLPANDRIRIHKSLMELYEIHALTFWEIEGVRTRLPSDPQRLTLPVDRVMSREDYKDLYDKVIERLMTNRNEFLKSEAQVSVEGIAEIVRGKHVLWSFALKNFFRANDILLDAANADNNKVFFKSLLEPTLVSTTQEVIEEVARMLHIPDVSQLTISQIEACRTFMPAFRNDLLEKVRSADDLIFDREQIIRKTADAIVDQFVDYMLEKTFQMESSDRTAKWSLNQLLFPREVKDNSDRFFRWEDETDSPAPELLLWKLKSEQLAETDLPVISDT